MKTALVLIPAFFILPCCIFEQEPYHNTWSTEGSRYPDNAFDNEIYGALKDPDTTYMLEGFVLPDSKMRLLFYQADAAPGDFTYLVCSPEMHESVLDWYSPYLWRIQSGDQLYLHVHGNYLLADSIAEHPRFYFEFCAAAGEPDTFRYYDQHFEKDFDKPFSDLTTIKELSGYLLLDSEGDPLIASNSYTSHFVANIARLIPANDSLAELTFDHYDAFVYSYHLSKRYLFINVKGEFKPLLYEGDNEEFIFHEITFVDSTFAENEFTFNWP